MRSQDEFAKTAIEAGGATRDHRRMSESIDLLKQGLKKPGKTQRGLARALKLDDSAVSRILKGTRQIKHDEMTAAKQYLEMPEPGRESPEPMTLDALRDKALPALTDAGAWPKDVPIMGVTVGGNDADFTVNMGEAVDYARRPPVIARNAKVFALYVQGTSMSRWRDPGNLVYLDRIRPPKPGDRVVVECKPDKEGEGHPAYLKELLARTGTKLRLRQYNPEGTIELPLAKVLKIHRVIEWEELLGI